MQAIPSSYRDQSGYVFMHQGQYYRAVNDSYEMHYRQLIDSGLYMALVGKKLLIAHNEVDSFPFEKPIVRVLHPSQIANISYAYEWSFSMLQDAAICTLNNALIAIEHQMILKDANTYNIQFVNGSPLLIDTLSFEKYNETESWIAYRQFCEHFLAPLLLMHYKDTSLNTLLLTYPNGIPLSLCKKLLPFKARWNVHVYLHVFLQAKVQRRKSSEEKKQTPQFSKQKMLNLLNGLKQFVRSLQPYQEKTTWDNYYDETILSQQYLQEKKTLVSNYLSQVEYNTVLDAGANEGEFSLLAINQNKTVIALDADINCIEKLYMHCKQDKLRHILPLVCNLTFPSPAIGWDNEERPALFQRISPDITLALALIHHLAIANNVSLKKIISFFHTLSPYLIIEFVPKEDAKVQYLLAHRADVFNDYDLVHFKKLLAPLFTILQEDTVATTKRTLFLLHRK